MPESIQWDRVAPFYDIYAQATFDIPFFVREAQKSSGDILELMSGTGRVSLPLIQAGARLTCVDNSAEMLARLRDKLAREQLSAQVHKMDVRDLTLYKQFDLIIIPFHSFGELTSSPDQKQALARIYEHLAEKGRFICTFHNPSQRLRSVDGQLRLIGNYPAAERQATLLFWSVATYDATTQIVHALQFYEHFDKDGVMLERSLLQINFMLLQKADFEALAADAGFRVIALYGDYSSTPFQEETSPYMIWVLGK